MRFGCKIRFLGPRFPRFEILIFLILKIDPNSLCDSYHTVMAWICLLGLLRVLYKRRILEEIGGLIGKVAKLDFNTDNGSRGRFARIARVKYESLPVVFFSCGRYGHVRDLFPSKGLELGRGGYKETATMEVQPEKDKIVEALETYGPWMIVGR
ncbi:hypothetical protein Gotur_032713 [Gossypium turneri]